MQFQQRLRLHQHPMNLCLRNAGLFFVSIALVCCVTFARAEDIYVSQNSSGTGSGLNSGNTKALSFFNTASNWNSPTKITGKIGPGDTVHLVGTISTSLVVQGSGTSGNVITVLFEPGAALSKNFWGVGNNSAIVATNQQFVVIDGSNVGVIECTANGDSLANAQQSRGMDLSRCNNWEIKRLTIRGIYVHIYNTSSAVDTRAISAFDCNSLFIHNNVITDSYYGVIAGAASPTLTSSINIFANSISRCSTGVVVGLGSVGGRLDIVQIYGNDITMGLNWYDTPDANHIDGIHNFGNFGTSDQITNMAIYNNYIHGDPSAHSTGHIYLEYDIISPKIYNNVLVSQTNAGSNGFIAIKSQSTTAASSAQIYNNTIIGIGTGNTGGIGVNLDANVNAAPIIKNNIFSTLFVGIYEPQNKATITSNFNLYYNIGTIGWRTAISTTLAQWRAAISGEFNSISANPLIASDYRIPTFSPAAGTGTSISLFNTDIAGTPRAVWDMGAFVAGASALPTNVALSFVP